MIEFLWSNQINVINSKWKFHGNEHTLGKYIIASYSYATVRYCCRYHRSEFNFEYKKWAIEKLHFNVFTNMFELYKWCFFLSLFFLCRLSTREFRVPDMGRSVEWILNQVRQQLVPP